MDARRTCAAARDARRPARGPVSSQRRGFTLVELLTVVVIIGILASLVTAAAMMARTFVRKREIQAEVQQLDLAIKAFKEKYKAYPPDMTNEREVVAFLRGAFPRYEPSPSTNANKWRTDMQNAGVNPSSMDPASALVFWLGGVPKPGTLEMNGFSLNPFNPFDTNANYGRTDPFFEFKPNRLIATGGNYYYYQPNFMQGADPYVYFRANQYGYYGLNANGTPSSTPKSWNNRCKACLDVRAGNQSWANPKTFQIRAPGLDGKHGTGMQFPSGADYNDDQFDDISNFSEGTFEDMLP